MSPLNIVSSLVPLRLLTTGLLIWDAASCACRKVGAASSAADPSR
jgi:hypothetical protein